MHKLLVGSMIVACLAGCFGGEPGRPADAVVRGIHYVGMTVSDLDQSEGFYRSADLQVAERGEIRNNPVIDELAGRDGVRADTRLLKSVNAQLRMMQFDSPSAAAQKAPQLEVFGPGISHVCYQVAESTQTYQNFIAAGAEPIGAPDLVHLNPKNPVYYGYARDKDRAMIEVEHVDVAQLNLPNPPKNKYRIRHVSLATPNMDRAVEFYSKLLQEENPRWAGRWYSLASERMDEVSGLPGSEIEMAWFQVRNLELELIQYVSHNPEDLDAPRPIDALGYNMIVFDVASLDAARQRLELAGAKVEVEPQPMDGGEIMFARDPDGNLLGFQVLAADTPLSAQNFAGNGT